MNTGFARGLYALLKTGSVEDFGFDREDFGFAREDFGFGREDFGFLPFDLFSASQDVVKVA